MLRTQTLNEVNMTDTKKKQLKNALGLEHFSPEQSSDETMKQKIDGLNNNKIIFSRPLIIVWTL